jgi:hypothetical protein
LNDTRFAVAANRLITVLIVTLAESPLERPENERQRNGISDQEAASTQVVKG